MVSLSNHEVRARGYEGRCHALVVRQAHHFTLRCWTSGEPPVAVQEVRQWPLRVL
jgi:hypothetical protein